MPIGNVYVGREVAANDGGAGGAVVATGRAQAVPAQGRKAAGKGGGKRAGAGDTPAARGRFSREKGKRGERAVCSLIHDLLGMDARRRVRQHDGDSDVLGVPGWAIESKCCAEDNRKQWWAQAVEQARNAKAMSDVPCLWFKLPRRSWRVLMPLAVILRIDATAPKMESWYGYDWTIEMSPEAWACVVRELMP